MKDEKFWKAFNEYQKCYAEWKSAFSDENKGRSIRAMKRKAIAERNMYYACLRMMMELHLSDYDHVEIADQWLVEADFEMHARQHLNEYHSWKRFINDKMGLYL